MGDKLKRREFIKLAALTGLTLPHFVSNIACRRSSRQPNIFFIMSDDHACRAISCYENQLVSTPHIDRLSNEGRRFELNFSTNAICAPSRASILTGEYSHRHGVIDNRLAFDPQHLTLPLLFQQAGYQTALLGKWHLKSQPAGFDYYCILPGQGHYYNPDFIVNGQKETRPGYVTQLITDACLEWLKARDKTKPFFLLLHHKAPHRNWMPDLGELNLFRDQDLPVPETYFDDYQGRCPAARLQEMRVADHTYLVYDLKVFPFKETELSQRDQVGLRYWHNVFNRLTDEQKQAWDKAYREENEEFKRKPPEGKELALWKYQRYIKDYLRCIVSVDRSVGQVLDYLDKEGLTDNTIVIYTSDQGFFLGEHGWFDKRFMYEPSLRSPLLIRYPEGLERGVDRENMIINVDLAPTLLDLAGLEIPANMQGRSFKPLLQGKKVPWRESFYYHYYEYPAVHAVRRHYGIRTRRYKLIHYYYDIDCWELFDLERDPQELVNCYNDPAYQEIKDKLTQELFRLRAELEVKEDKVQS